MPSRKSSGPAKPATKTAISASPRSAPVPIATQVKSAITDLNALASPVIREEMSTRYGIHTKKAFGVRVSQIQQLAKRIKHKSSADNHAFAAALWKTGWYEARMLTAFIDDPALVTPVQMDRWAKDFDNWGICDTLCFKLFDRCPHAWSMVAKWCKSKDEFVKRAGFALMACLALHDKAAPDEDFLPFLPLFEAHAADDRNFVKKGVNWALRSLGRRGAPLRKSALEVATRLAQSDDAASRWIGKDAARVLGAK